MQFGGYKNVCISKKRKNFFQHFSSGAEYWKLQLSFSFSDGWIGSGIQETPIVYTKLFLPTPCVKLGNLSSRRGEIGTPELGVKNKFDKVTYK